MLGRERALYTLFERAPAANRRFLRENCSQNNNHHKIRFRMSGNRNFERKKRKRKRANLLGKCSGTTTFTISTDVAFHNW